MLERIRRVPRDTYKHKLTILDFLMSEMCRVTCEMVKEPDSLKRIIPGL